MMGCVALRVKLPVALETAVHWIIANLVRAIGDLHPIAQRAEIGLNQSG